MKKKFFAAYDLAELRSRVNSIIDVENRDNLRTHFKQAILFKEESIVSGQITDRYFKIWTHEQGRSGATGIFYPIIVGHIKLLNRGLEIEFKSKPNLIGTIIALPVMIILAYTILFNIVIQENNELRYLIPRILIGIILFGMMISLPVFIHFRTLRIKRKFLIKKLGLNLI